jgi:cytosine deaminase
LSALLLKSVRPWGAETCDVRIADGRIVEIAAELSAGGGGETFDGAGCLLLPGLVNAHTHIDKTLWGQAWHSHRAGPTVMDRIENERRVLSELQLSPLQQSAQLLQHMIALGTTHVRTHVDIGPQIGLTHFRAVKQVQAQYRDWLDIEIVAFPQTGVVTAPGTLDLLEQAAREGAEVIGGLDPMGIDHDPQGQLDGIFAIAERYGIGIDIHLHDGGELGAVTVEMIAERTRAHSMNGRVVVSHGFCLGSISEDRLHHLSALLAELDIAVMTHGPGGGTPYPPVRRLHDRGVHLFSGTDGVRDAWGPLNSADMLERAYLVAYVNGFRRDEDLELALELATYAGARVMQATAYGLDPGCQADLVLVEAETVAQAVIEHRPRRLVLKRGQVVARDGRCVATVASPS